MDDTKQQQSQTPLTGQTQGGTLVQFPQTGQQSTSQGQEPVKNTSEDAASSSVLKEQEPFGQTKPITTEQVSFSEHTVELAPEVKDAGVVEVAHTPTIPTEVAKAGVTSSPDAHLPIKPQAPQLKSPVSQEKAEQLTKGSFLFKNPSSSLLWLALVVLRQLRIKKQQEDSHAA